LTPFVVFATISDEPHQRLFFFLSGRHIFNNARYHAGIYRDNHGKEQSMMATLRAPRRTKTYIAFDGDTDLMSYRTIQSWSADPKYPFSLNDAHEINYARDGSLPQSIINQLRERLKASKHLVLIVGSATNRNRKGILQYEIRYALRNSLPIILVFKGFGSDVENDGDLWNSKLKPKIPAVLRNWTGTKYCLVCPFTRDVVVRAIYGYSNNKLPSEGYTWHWNV
jgi:hypothetical protein